jgi:membrane protease YdiL (CAAX protease family)
MSFYFAVGWLVDINTESITKLTNGLSGDLKYGLSILLSIVWTYIVPIGFTLFVFSDVKRDGGARSWYKPPRNHKNFAKAIGNFPAMYGLGMATNILTLLGFYVVLRLLGDSFDFLNQINTTGHALPATPSTAVLIFLMYAIIAPFFEEFWLRGLVWNALKPFGVVFSIFSTALLFGILHGNIRQFFYTFALGVALGYVRYVCNSVLVTTILHAMFNSVAAIALLLTAASSGAFQQDYLNDSADISTLSPEELEAYSNEIARQDELHKLFTSLTNLFTVFILILMVVGIAAFLRKIPQLKKIKFAQPETTLEPLREKTKWRIFLTSPLMFVLYAIIIGLAVYAYV